MSDHAPCLPCDAAEGNARAVAAQLAGGAAVDRGRALTGETLLFLAAQNGHADVVRALLAAGAAVDLAQVPNGATPLLGAAKNGHVDVMNALADAGAALDVAVEHGASHMVTTKRNGVDCQVEELLGDGDTVTFASSYGVSPLSIAALRGHTNAVKLLLERGADAARPVPGGPTPLVLAVQHGHADVVKELVVAGAPVGSITEVGSAWHVAVIAKPRLSSVSRALRSTPVGPPAVRVYADVMLGRTPLTVDVMRPLLRPGRVRFARDMRATHHLLHMCTIASVDVRQAVGAEEQADVQRPHFQNVYHPVWNKLRDDEKHLALQTVTEAMRFGLLGAESYYALYTAYDVGCEMAIQRGDVSRRLSFLHAQQVSLFEAGTQVVKVARAQYDELTRAFDAQAKMEVKVDAMCQAGKHLRHEFDNLRRDLAHRDAHTRKVVL
ncbi:hypothetical protein I4F81_012799 [Pyropia yezoensis]|uniref:Uncharacterized protein n=1 Tax=Pyropia yezoensis TaxID=2788 RepID=A0ACC3CJG6_PYRYE|nr:hypothetical protein I4F81_012799 [Neopyropia yezoensis]|eukprot:contig_11233_g2684